MRSLRGLDLFLKIHPHRRKIDAAAQEKTLRRAGVRRRDMENKRVEQDHVARRAGVLDDSQRDATMFFNVVHETRRAVAGIAVGV